MSFYQGSIGVEYEVATDLASNITTQSVRGYLESSIDDGYYFKGSTIKVLHESIYFEGKTSWYKFRRGNNLTFDYIYDIYLNKLVGKCISYSSNLWEKTRY